LRFNRKLELYVLSIFSHRRSLNMRSAGGF
jgi:hypothetical protein